MAKTKTIFMAAPIQPPRNNAELIALRDQLDGAHNRFLAKSSEVRVPACLMSFLLIGSFIVIGSSCFCLGLPGVNVVRDVILRGVLPGGCGILLSIPCIIKTVKLSKEKTRIYDDEVFPLVKAILKGRLIDDVAGSKILFIENNLMYRGGLPSRDYQDYFRTVLTQASKYCTDRKKEHPHQGPRYQLRLDAIKDAMTNLLQAPYKARKT
jgi:hypothetical protein